MLRNTIRIAKCKVLGSHRLEPSPLGNFRNHFRDAAGRSVERNVGLGYDTDASVLIIADRKSANLMFFA